MLSTGKLRPRVLASPARFALSILVGLTIVVGVAAAATPPRPDLVVRSVSAPPGSLVQGKSFRSTITVKNVGRAGARSSTARAYLSKDIQKGAGDKRLAPGWSVPRLGPGKSARRSVTLAVPASTPTGLWYVIVCADDTRRVRESHEGNNCRRAATRLSVQSAPPPPPPNEAPTDIALSDSTVAENLPAGTAVGSLTTTDPDAGDVHTYTLVAGTGSTDNAKFQIGAGGELQTSGPLDFEAGASLSVRIQTNDGHGGTFQKAFAISVTNVNDSPSDIALSPSSVAENQPSATTVGTLSATDQDAGDTATFTLVAGTGSADNASFSIVGTSLRTAAVFDFEAKASYSIRVRATDGSAATFEKAMTVSVTNANDAPTDIALAPASVAENQPSATTVGALTATDQDAGDTATFTLVAGTGSTDNASFSIVSGSLRTAAVFDFETKSSFSIRVRVTDGAALTFEKALTVSVTNVNEAPTDIGLSPSSVAENQASGTTVGTFSRTDPDGAGDSATYALVAGTGSTDNASFSIVTGSLRTAASFDFETKASYSIRVRVTDGGALTFEKALTVSVTNVNDAPTNISLTASSINENQPSATTIGSLTATDQDVGQTHTFSLVSPGCGGGTFADNASFSISGASLRSAVSFNFEVKSSYTVCLRALDNGAPALSFDKQFTISVVDVNDAPVAVTDGYTGAVGNTLAAVQTTPAGPNVALTGNVLTANDTDEDATLPHTLSATAETVASTGGGSATIAANGSFTFLPGVGDKNQTDSFTYHVTDGSLTTAGTVTVGIADALVWYVNNSIGVNGDGRSSAPFNTLAGVNGAGGTGDVDGTSDILFVYQGLGSYTGGLPLETNQKLIGQPFGLTVTGKTIVAAGGTNPTVTNGAGAGITLANGNTIERVNVSGSSGAGVTGTSVSTLSYGASTTISGNTGGGLVLSGAGSGAITVGSTITSGGGNSVSIANRTGGTVSLTGAITDTGGGLRFTSNTGTTITLSGGVSASTGANGAFSATGGGTINVTGSNNTLATTTGTTLNVASTTIGTSGITFRSITANGAASGIVLNNTGTSGGLTITGTGAQNSGGTIQNTTGPGVSLTSTDNFNADELSITGSNTAGIDGTEVTNFTFTDGEIINAGDSRTNPLDGSIAFNDQAAGTENNIDGVLVITGNLLKDAYGGGVDVFNRAGTITDATVSNNTLDSPADEALTKEDAISFNLFGNASTVASLMKAQVQNNVITDFPSGNGITFLGSQPNLSPAPTPTVGVPGSSTNRILIDGNLLTGDPVNRFGGAAILAGVEGRGQGNFDITNNGTVASPITNVGTHAIATGNSGSSTVDYLIEGNRINANNFEAGGGGIRSATDKNIMVGGTTLSTPTMNTIINNNVVRNTTGIGIRVLAMNSNGTAQVKVTNNDVANGGAGTPPIDIANGSSNDAAFSHTMCATISGNTTVANAPSGGGNTFPGILLSKRFTTANQYPFGLTGLSPSPSTNANTEAYVTGLNPNASVGGGFYAGKKVAVNVGDNYVSCTHPPGF